MARDQLETLVLAMSADFRRMEKEMARGERNFNRTADSIERRQRQLDKNLSQLGSQFGNFAAPVQTASALALGAITALSYQAAKRAEAVDGAFQQTFRNMPKEASTAASAVSDEFNRLETDVKENFTQMSSVMTALGLEASQALSVTDQLQRRSLDLAAFRDVEDAEAFRAVMSGITGETEPLKRFGVVLNETAVKAELLRLGFKGNAQEASEAAKVTARANIILRQTADVQGQVAREAGNATEKEKALRTEFTRTAEQFGKQFLPVAVEVLGWATDALTAFNNLPAGTQAAGLGLLALVAASGPIAMVIKGLSDLIKAAIAARAAVAALGASGGAGALGKGAAAGGAAGLLTRVAPTAGIGAGLLVGTGSFIAAPDRDRDVVEASLKFEQDRLARLKREGRSSRAIGGAEERVARLQAEVSRLAATAADGAVNEVEAAVQTALANAPEFKLTETDKTPVGGGAGGGSGAGQQRAEAAAEKRRAEAREALALQQAIDIARASGDQASLKAAEERQTLVQMTAQYEAAGYTDARARAVEHLTYINAAEMAAEEREKAEKQIDDILEGRRRQIERDADYAQLLNDQLFDRLGYEAELARISGEDGAIRNAERRLFIEERTLEILRLKLAATEAEARAMAGGEFDTMAAAEDGRAIASSMVSLLRSDNIWEEAGRRFKDAAWDGVEDFLAQLFKGMNTGGAGGGGNWLSTIASVFTGGRKAATGRSATAGFPVLIGERRPEVFVPNTSGTIIPSVNAAVGRAQRAASAPSMISPVVRIDLTGANGDQTIRYLAAEAARQAYAEAVSTSSRVVPAQQAQRKRYSRGG